MAEKEKNNELENMSFEDAINELEKIVDELEGNEISLDEAVNAYERGSKLKNICQERLNEAKMKVEKIKDSDNQEEIKEKTEALQKVMHEASAELYKQEAAAGQQPGDQPGEQAQAEESAKSDDDVVDADYTEVDDKK